MWDLACIQGLTASTHTCMVNVTCITLRSYNLNANVSWMHSNHNARMLNNRSLYVTGSPVKLDFDLEKNSTKLKICSKHQYMVWNIISKVRKKPPWAKKLWQFRKNNIYGKIHQKWLTGNIGMWYIKQYQVHTVPLRTQRAKYLTSRHQTSNKRTNFTGDVRILKFSVRISPRILTKNLRPQHSNLGSAVSPRPSAWLSPAKHFIGDGTLSQVLLSNRQNNDV